MKKKLLAMLLAAVLAVSLLPGTAWAEEAPTSGECGDNLTWTYSNGVLTIEGTGPMANYEGYLLPPWFSLNKQITTVTIGIGVTSIGEIAFIQCESLTSVSIPNSVTSIGTGAFRSCTSLTSVTIPNSVTTIGEMAFASCSSLTDVTISNGVTTISEGAFSYCTNLTSVTIPASVTTIGESAFQACSSLATVTIPVSVTVIDGWAFADCDSLSAVNYGGSAAQWGQILCNGVIITGHAAIPQQLAFSDGGQELAGLTGVTVNYTGTTEPTEPTTPSFTDVPEGVWYYEAVQWAADKGYIQGYNGEFSPNGSLTRGAIFTILARVDNVDTNGGSTWYEKGMNWAVENGVSDGTSPTGDITLEMLVTMLYRYENKPDADTSVLARFSDSSSLHTWTDCREAMAWAVEIGLVEGSGGKLDPLSTLARYRGAVVLKRYCEKLGK